MSIDPHPPEMLHASARTKTILGTIATVLIVAGALWLAYALRAVALLLVLSILIAYTLAPLVALCERPFRFRGRERGLSRGEAIAAVYLGGLALLVGGLSLALPRITRQLGALDQQLPVVLADPHDWSQRAAERYRALHLPPALRDALDQAVSQGFAAVEQSLRAFLYEAASLVRYLHWLVLIPVIAIFLLKDAPRFSSSILGLLPQGRVRWRGREFFDEVNRTIAFYVRAQLFACLFIGLVCTMGFLALGVPYAWLLGGAAGVLELIPMVGPLLAALAAGLVAGARAPQLAVYTLLFLAALRGVHDNVVYPRLIASGIKLHPLAVILALLCGAELAGAIGLFLAIPLTAFLSVAYRHLHRQWHGSGLLAEMLQAREPEPAPVPPVRAPPEIPLTAEAEQGTLQGVRVLVVDDDDDGQALLAGLLESQGAVVSCAGSGAQALALLSQSRFDVMLSDIGMPDEDGFELIRRVRALAAEAGGDTPAAALTGYDMDEDRERASAAGFQRHLSKPIDAQELLTTVATLAGTTAPRGVVSR